MHSDSVLIEVGKAVAMIQFADKRLKDVLLLVFPGKELNDLYVFQRNETLINKATLGKLLSTLRSRVSLHENFDEFLNTYLSNRNSLIHNWDEIDGWEQESKARDFLNQVQKQAAYLTYVSLGLMRLWMEQVNFPSSDREFPELQQLFEKIDSKWKPLANEFIKEIKKT